MTTRFITEASDALFEHLLTFVTALTPTLVIRFTHEAVIPAYGTTYIDAMVDASTRKTQDMGSEITTRYDGRLVLDLQVPEQDGDSLLVELADELTEHFFPGAVPIAYSYQSLPANQAAHILNSPGLEGPFRREGGYVKRNYMVDFMVQTQRNI